VLLQDGSERAAPACYRFLPSVPPLPIILATSFPAMIGAEPCCAWAQHKTSLAITEPAKPSDALRQHLHSTLRNYSRITDILFR
jgi:hypothetical protein